MIKVLIVEDSRVLQEALKYVLASDPEIKVIGTAGNGAEALEFISRQKPDVITMDLIMPVMDGYAATRKIMETNPIPIVVVSANLEPDEEKKTWLCIEAGAVAAIEKPRFAEGGIAGSDAINIVETVKLMSQLKLVRRWTGKAGRQVPRPILKETPTPIASPTHSKPELVAIGASTGGPAVLQTILSGLPASFPVPIMVVQHISPGFCDGLVRWLDESSRLEVRSAANGEKLRPGVVYVAPDGFQMGVKPGGIVALTDDQAENGLRPSASYLFRTVARAFGGRAVGVLVTGMGRDGAYELKMMRDRGAVTIAQDEASSVVHGMPGEAIRLGGASYVLSPDEIAKALLRLTAAGKE